MVKETTTAAEEKPADATEAATDAVPAIEDLLTVEGFDYDAVAAYVETAELNPLVKTSVQTLLEQAKANPDTLQATLDALRQALGL